MRSGQSSYILNNNDTSPKTLFQNFLSDLKSVNVSSYKKLKRYQIRQQEIGTRCLELLKKIIWHYFTCWPVSYFHAFLSTEQIINLVLSNQIVASFMLLQGLKLLRFVR